MVTVTFPARDTEKRALACLLGRFSGRVLRTGEHLPTNPGLTLRLNDFRRFPLDGCDVRLPCGRDGLHRSLRGSRLENAVLRLQIGEPGCFTSGFPLLFGLLLSPSQNLRRVAAPRGSNRRWRTVG